jgi:oligopeptide transport system permease protein
MALVAAQKKSNVKKAEALSFSRPPRGLTSDALCRLKRNRAATIGMVVIGIFWVMAIFAPVLAPHNPLQINAGKGFLPPVWVARSSTGAAGSADFLLGTDTLGRDVLSRVIYGARVSMIVGFVPTLIIVLVGVLIGMAAGYSGGVVDNLLMRFTDIVYAFPDLLFFIIVMVALRDSFVGTLLNGLFLLFAALAMVNWVGVARIVRGQVLSLKQNEFVDAARCVGARNMRIMFRHILPNALSPVTVVVAFTIPAMIINEAILGYLGLGLRPATDPQAFFVTSWGALLLEGQTSISAQPFILLAPAACVALVVLAFTFLGDGLRSALDPRTRST